jgi:hypothetical protein
MQNDSSCNCYKNKKNENTEYDCNCVDSSIRCNNVVIISCNFFLDPVRTVNHLVFGLTIDILIILQILSIKTKVKHPQYRKSLAIVSIHSIVLQFVAVWILCPFLRIPLLLILLLLHNRFRGNRTKSHRNPFLSFQHCISFPCMVSLL